MTCPALNPKLPESACPERVLSITGSAGLALCRACPRGRALMESLRGSMPDRFFSNLPELKESIVQNKKTYTVRELADELGVPRKHIENARKSDSPRPGSKSHAVQEGMRQRGITWDQVAIGRSGGAETIKAAVPTAPAAPEPGSGPAAVESEIGKPIETDRAPFLAGCGCDSPLGHVPFETLALEISRRMPGTKIVIG